MKLKKNAKKFLKLLAKELDLPIGSSKLKVKTAFEQGIKLVENSELQAELTNNSANYLPLLQRYVSEAKSEIKELNNTDVCVRETTKEGLDQNTEETEADYPYNLYLPQEDVEETENASVYRCYLSQHFDENFVQKIADTADKQVLGMCNVTQGSSVQLESVMMSFHRKMSTIVDETFIDMRLQRLRSTEKELLRYLLYFHTKYNPKDRIQRDCTVVPKYEDIVAALLSLYVDVTCMIARKVEESEIVQLQKKMVMLINQVLRNSSQHVMDVIIQMTQLSEDDTSFLLPLIRDIIERPGFSTKQPEVYTKYILTVHKICSSLSGEEIERLQKLALGTKAPKKYLNWLREKDEEVLENMPDNVPSFKGVNITRHLLEESNDDVFERLLNLLTIDENVLQEEESQESTGNASPVGLPNEELFFIDKLTTIGDLENNSEEDEEEIIIDDEMLDKELAAMDADDNESEQSEGESESDVKERNIVEDTAKALDKIGAESSEEVSDDGECIDVEEDDKSEDEGYGENLIVIDEAESNVVKSPQKATHLSPKKDKSEMWFDDIFFIDTSPCKEKLDKIQGKQQNNEPKGKKSNTSPSSSVNTKLTPTVCLGPDVRPSPSKRGQIGSPGSKGEDKPADSGAGDSVKRKNQQFLERGIAKSTLIESVDDSSNPVTPRRSSRSLLRQPLKTPDGNRCTNSPQKSAKITKEVDVEIYDFSSTLESGTAFSEVYSPRRNISRHGIQSQDDSQSGHGSDTSALSIEEIEEETNKRGTRNRTISQTSAVSATSTESISSLTRAKGSSAEIAKSSPRGPSRKSTPASVRDNKSESASPRGPGRPRRRSSLSDPKEPTPKKQRVEPTSIDSPRSLRSSARKRDSKTTQ